MLPTNSKNTAGLFQTGPFQTLPGEKPTLSHEDSRLCEKAIELAKNSTHSRKKRDEYSKTLQNNPTLAREFIRESEQRQAIEIIHKTGMHPAESYIEIERIKTDPAYAHEVIEHYEANEANKCTIS